MNATEGPELGSVDLKKYWKVLKKITVELGYNFSYHYLLYQKFSQGKKFREVWSEVGDTECIREEGD